MILTLGTDFLLVDENFGEAFSDRQNWLEVVTIC